MLSGVPSVVLGFFGLIVLASFLQGVFGYQSRLNAFVAGIALGLAVIPVVFSIAEDALTSVPRAYTQGALALGASKWQAAWQIVLPAAAPGVFAAVVLGFGRAIGETMVVLMASGNASIVSASLLDSTRSITATIAAELAEAVFGGHHYRMLFLIGAMLFVVTFLTNLAGDLVMHRLKGRLEGKAK
jgi:phosphate transport system permease protein